MLEKIAPIILFVFNRPIHTRKTLDALAANNFAKKSNLFIFSDGPKDNSQYSLVNEVRKIISDKKYTSLFKSIKIKESKNNNGLAKSVIEGVTDVFKFYPSVIVLEDDLITSNDFLSYMNQALSFYEKNPQIGCISGYSPIKDLELNEDVYLTTRNCSWGWAIWKEEWDNIDWEVVDYCDFKKSKIKRKIFNKYGFDRSVRMDNHFKSRTHSWSIRLGYSLAMQNKYTVYPKISKLSNVGFDGTGTNSHKKNSSYENFNSSMNKEIKDIVFPVRPKEYGFIQKEFIRLYSGNWWNRIKLRFQNYWNIYTGR